MALILSKTLQNLIYSSMLIYHLYIFGTVVLL